MNELNYPFSTQDWNLAKNNPIALQASQLKSIESLNGIFWVTIDAHSQDYFLNNLDRLDVPSGQGLIIVEALSERALLRIRQTGDEHINAPSSSFGRALKVSLLSPTVNALRNLANRLDPLLNSTR